MKLVPDAVLTDLKHISQSVMGSTTNLGETITIRRGDTTLAAQDVRLLRPQTTRRQRSTRGEANEVNVLVAGGPSLDIQAGDRFNDRHGTLYQVVFVRPNRQVETVAEAEAIQ